MNDKNKDKDKDKDRPGKGRKKYSAPLLKEMGVLAVSKVAFATTTS